MKTLLKALFVSLVALLSFTGKVDAKEFTNFFGFGSYENALTNYFLSDSIAIEFSIFGYTTNHTGFKVAGDGVVLKKAPKTLEEVNAIVRKMWLTNTSKVLTNRFLDKSQPLYLQTFTWGPRLFEAVYLIREEDFYLTKSSSGVYSLPDFSQKELRVVGYMMYQIPDLKWIRVECDVESFNPAPDSDYVGMEAVTDSDIVQVPWIVLDKGIVGLPTYLVTNNLIKQISIRTGNDETLRVFGSDGLPKPETPITLEITGASIKISGEAGRKVKLRHKLTLDAAWESTDIVEITEIEAKVSTQTVGKVRLRNKLKLGAASEPTGTVEITLPSYPVYVDITSEPTGFYSAVGY